MNHDDELPSFGNLKTDGTWKQLEPNSYEDFAKQRVERHPIKSDRLERVLGRDSVKAKGVEHLRLYFDRKSFRFVERAMEIHNFMRKQGLSINMELSFDCKNNPMLETSRDGRKHEWHWAHLEHQAFFNEERESRSLEEAMAMMIVQYWKQEEGSAIPEDHIADQMAYWGHALPGKDFEITEEFTTYINPDADQPKSPTVQDLQDIVNKFEALPKSEQLKPPVISRSWTGPYLASEMEKLDMQVDITRAISKRITEHVQKHGFVRASQLFAGVFRDNDAGR